MASYIYEICIGVAICFSMILVFRILRYADYNPFHLEIAINRLWPNMSKLNVQLLYIICLIMIMLPLMFIVVFAYFLNKRGPYGKLWNISLGAGLMISMIYVGIIGCLSWKHSLWYRTWFENACLCFCALGFIAFLALYESHDYMSYYEPHTTICFVPNLVFMTIFIYSITVESSINLVQLYFQFLQYYEKKAKSSIKEEIKSPASLISPQGSKEESKEETSQIENEANTPEPNLINLSLIVSKVSVESGERSHVARAPQEFPVLQHRLNLQTQEIERADNYYKQEFQEIVKAIKETNKNEVLKRVLSLGLVGFSYVIYNAVHYIIDVKTKYKRIGMIQTFVVIYLDLLILLWSRSKLRKPRHPIIEPTLLMLICRVILCLSSRYWIITHCAIFLILTSVMGTSLCKY